MGKDNIVDEMLKETLFSQEKPDESLNQKIRCRIQEENINMKPLKIKFIPVAVLSLCLLTVSVFAMGRLLSLNEAVEKLEDPAVKAIFQSSNSTEINKSQVSGGYNITLLGIASGNEVKKLDSSLESTGNYAIVAIEKVGGDMPETSSDDFEMLYVSPYIKGQQPWMYNAHTLGGGTSAVVVDGVMYHALSCDNLNIFADRGVYLGVNEGSFYNGDAFIFNSETGEMTPNESFDGINALFELPLDLSKSDYEAAEKYLADIFKEPEPGVNGDDIDELDGEYYMLEGEDGDVIIETYE